LANRRVIAYVVAAQALAVGALFSPAPAGASTGGSGVGPGTTPGPNQPAVTPSNPLVSASSDGVTIATLAAAPLRGRLRLMGSVPSGDAGAEVDIQRLYPRPGSAWVTTVRTHVRADGSFTVVWRTNRTGRFQIRAVVVGANGATTATAPPVVTVTIYRTALATFYGPGFYGSTTACGEVLTKHTFGVANRTLKCGTMVAIYYGGQTIVVPVIDRGPYSNGADWDLTEATASLLGMTETDTIGAVSVPSSSTPGAS
jgi:hypothetical protein